MREGQAKLPDTGDTIVAISTPDGRSGIGVVRMSGPRAAEILERFFRSPEAAEARRARYGAWSDTAGQLLDRVVVTVFAAPHSYTGEDVVEVSAHGNPLILNEIVECCASVGARRATAGEFTLRAVRSGRMDLVQAEAIRDFIEAQTQTQARTAMLQIDGVLARRLGPEREAVLDTVARLEAGIDFAEDDVPIPDPAPIADQLASIAGRLTGIAESYRYGRLIRHGVRLAIAGKPNVGKSSLFNRLVSADRAIVTEIPGTTRDVLTETVEVAGVPVRFADTAGLHDAGDTVEKIGVGRTIETVAEADLTLVVLDRSRPLDGDDRAVLERTASRPHIVVINKTDLPEAWDDVDGRPGVRTSAATGAGIDDLVAAIGEYLTRGRPADVEGFVLTSARQHEALTRAAAALDKAAGGLRADVPHEMILLDLYAALAALGELTGEVVTDDILGRIFSTFCIGK